MPKSRVRIVKTDDRHAGCVVWGVHLDDKLIGWIQKERGSGTGLARLLSGWDFEADTDIHNPLGPRTNCFFVAGPRANIVKRINQRAEAMTQGGAA